MAAHYPLSQPFADFPRVPAYKSVAAVDESRDLNVRPPDNADLFDMVRLEADLSRIMGKEVDLISNRGLDPEIDQDILRDRVLL